MYTTIRRPLINNQIRTKEVRLIDENGTQAGIMPREKALALAQERGLDLIMVTSKTEPPVCKIGDYGKHLYTLKKKEKKTKKVGELKGIRLSFGISEHDLETRVNQASKFLNKDYKVRVEMRLRGREKRMTDFAKVKFKKFLEKLRQETPIKIENELKRQPRGLTMIIIKSSNVKPETIET